MPRNLWLLLLFMLMSYPPAGCSGLVRAGPKLAGKGCARGTAGKAAKVGAVKGATVGLASDILRHTADDASRVGLFVADDGAGALRVVMRNGDELTKSPAGLRALIDDFDAMANIADDAGVDLYLDLDVVPQLSRLAIGPNVRVWIARAEAPPMRLRQVANGVHEVAVAATRKVPARLWLRLAEDTAEAAIQLSQERARIHEVVVVDSDCGDVRGATVYDDVVRALEGTAGNVVLLADQEPDDRLLEVARIHNIDLVAFAPFDVCDADGLTDRARDALSQTYGVVTVGDMWALVATVDNPMVLTDVTRAGQWLSLSGDGIVASHNIYEPGLSNTPVWVVGSGMALGLLVGMVVLWVRR